MTGVGRKFTLPSVSNADAEVQGMRSSNRGLLDIFGRDKVLGNHLDRVCAKCPLLEAAKSLLFASRTQRT